jgi:cardiolipin synthase
VKRSDIPNIITIFRIGIVPAVVVALFYGQFTLALLLFGIAGISDGLDGYIANRFNYTSRLGSILDPLADKLLLISTYVALGWLGLLPVWLVAIVIGRDVLVVCGALAYHWLVGHYELAPSWISKVNTFFQIVLGLAVVFSAGVVALPTMLLDGLVIIVAFAVILSGVDYVWIWGVRAYHARRLQRGSTMTKEHD